MRLKKLSTRLIILALCALTVSPMLTLHPAYALPNIIPSPTEWSPFGPWEQKLLLKIYTSLISSLSAFSAGGSNGLDVLDDNLGTSCPSNADIVCVTSGGADYAALAGWDWSGTTSIVAPPGTGASLVSVLPASQPPCSGASGGFATGCGFWSLLNMRQKPNSQTVCPGGPPPPGCTVSSAFLPGNGDDELIRRSLTQTGGITHLDPFKATATDLAEREFLSLIYDSLLKTNPENSAQVIDWITISNTASGVFHLRPDVFFHNGGALTSSDVCFSIMAYKYVPAAYFGTLPGVSGTTNCTTPNPKTVVVTTCAGCLSDIASIPIIPMSIWAGICGAAYTGVFPAVSPFPAVNSCQPSSIYDPVLNGQMVGSGPWVCNPTVGISTIPGQMSCTQMGGASAGEVLGAGGIIFLRRYDLDVSSGSMGYMRCCPDEQKSLLHKFEWADVAASGIINILDVANCAIVYAIHSALCDSPLYGIDHNEIVDIAEIATLAFLYGEALSNPLNPPTSATSVDPQYDPYQWTIDGNPPVTFIGLYRPMAGSPGAEVELAARGGSIPAANAGLFSAELFPCPPNTLGGPDCASGSAGPPVVPAVSGTLEVGTTNEVVFSLPGPLAPGTYGVRISYNLPPVVQLNPFVEVIEGVLP